MTKVMVVTCSAHHGDGQDDGGEVLEVCHSSPTGSLVDGVDQVTEGSCQREDHQHLGSCVRGRVEVGWGWGHVHETHTGSCVLHSRHM